MVSYLDKYIFPYLDYMEDDQTLQEMCVLNESEKESSLERLCGKLYENIVRQDKFKDIDFGTITKSRGDITKIPEYMNCKDAIDNMEQIINKAQGSKEPIEILKKACENMESRVSLFSKAFGIGIEMPMIMYNTMVLSIITTTGMFIAATIEYIKNPNSKSYKIELDKVGLNKTKDHILFKNLERFNKSCLKGDFDKSINFLINRYSNEKGLIGVSSIALGSLGVSALVILMTSIIPIIRELIFFYYAARTNIADYLEAQSKLLEMNAYSVSNNESLDEEEREAIFKRQQDIAKAFSSLASKIQVDCTKAGKESVKASKIEANRKFKTSEVLEKEPEAMSNGESESSLF